MLVQFIFEEMRKLQEEGKNAYLGNILNSLLPHSKSKEGFQLLPFVLPKDGGRSFQTKLEPVFNREFLHEFYVI